MVYVKGGSFLMGGIDIEAYGDEKPVHKVSITDFYIGKYLVTQELWEEIMGKIPSFFRGLDLPVEGVSWKDAESFLLNLNKITGKNYRLPTESEWEYAARGGINSEGYVYAGSDRLEEVSWFGENSGGESHSVGKKLGNELGLYDMNGNVWEWVEDQWHSSYHGAPFDGSAWTDRSVNADRVRRGGSWRRKARDCRVSNRLHHSPSFRGKSIGFRLAMFL